MTKKDFELIARALRQTKPSFEPEANQWRISVTGIAMALASENPRFNYSLFLDAAGYEPIMNAERWI